MRDQLQTRFVRRGRRQWQEVRDPETGRWRRVDVRDPRDLGLTDGADDLVVHPRRPGGDSIEGPARPEDLFANS